MNTQEIIEGNKLIAEFMNVETAIGIKDNLYRLDEFSYWEPIPYQSEFDRKNYFYASELKYHSSWDWLMPVVEKIEGTKQADIIIHTKNLVQISYNKETKTYFYGSLLQNAWDACIEFIKWYNQNK